MDRRSLLGLAAGALAMPGLARAQSRYPDRPIRCIVPFPAGGATDIWARMVGEGMIAELGQPIIVENRGGGGGMIGADAAAKATPDGYTILFNITTHVQAPVVLRRFPYDPVEDFFFVGRLGTTAITFCVGPAVPAAVTTLDEFIAWGKGRDLAFGNYAQGSTGHAYALMLAQETRLNATQVAYRGEAPMLTDLLAGTFHGGFHSTVGAGEMMRAGRIRPLGYSDRFRFTGFVGMMAPAGIPAEAKERLAQAFNRVANAPAMKQRLQAMDTIPGYEDPETFRATARRTLEQWSELAKSLDLYATG
jgi:tripartite-type tricarboxylate transporter receptor subunit TctC